MGSALQRTAIPALILATVLAVLLAAIIAVSPATATPTVTPNQAPKPKPLPEVDLEVITPEPVVGVIGESVTVTAKVSGDATIFDRVEVRLCDNLSGCEPPSVTAKPDGNGIVSLEWEAAGQTNQSRTLYLSAMLSGESEGDTRTHLKTIGCTVYVLPADGMIYAELGAKDPNKGKVAGIVAQPEPVIDTLAIYPTPTPPPRIDAEIIGIYASPSGKAMQGQHVEISVTVRNNGDYAINIPVELTFPSSEKQPERRSPRVEPGTTATAAFTWKTRNYQAGVYTLRVRLRVEGNTTLGNAATELPLELIQAEIAASIMSVNTSPPAPVVGEPVKITVAVRNQGPVSANIPVTLHFPSADKQAETRRPHAGADETVTTTFEWRTTRYDPGDHTFYVEVARDWQFFTIPLLPPTVDFTVSELLTPGAAEPIVKGDWVEVTALVSNLGPYAGSGKVTLLDRMGERIMYRKRVSLEPGESRTVAFTWKTLRYEVGEYLLQVTADSEHDVERSNDGSDTVGLSILTHRHITVGFESSEPESIVHGSPAKAGIRSGPAYPRDIVAYDSGTMAASAVAHPVTETGFGVPPQATELERLRREAQGSAVRCMEYQRQTGASQPRAALCPVAPPLVR